MLQYHTKAKSTNRSSLQRRNNTKQPIKTKAPPASKSRLLSISLNVLLPTLGSKFLLCPLKGPLSKTHSENYGTKPHIHRTPKSKVPAVADFQNELPLQDFNVRDLKQISHLQKIKILWIRSSSSPHDTSKMLTYYFIIQWTASFISKCLLKACQMYRHEYIKNFNWTIHVLTYSTYSNLNSEPAKTHLRETPQAGRQAQGNHRDTHGPNQRPATHWIFSV